MSLVITNCAGHVHVLKQEGGGTGFYQIGPKASALPVVSGAKILLHGIPLAYQEIVQPTVTLDDKRTIYVFGSAWAEAGVDGVMLMGDNNSSMQIVNSLIDWYDSRRISKNKDGIQLSMGNKGYQSYLVGMRLGQVDPKINAQEFSLQLLISKD